MAAKKHVLETDITDIVVEANALKPPKLESTQDLVEYGGESNLTYQQLAKIAITSDYKLGSPSLLPSPKSMLIRGAINTVANTARNQKKKVKTATGRIVEIPTMINIRPKGETIRTEDDGKSGSREYAVDYALAIEDDSGQGLRYATDQSVIPAILRAIWSSGFSVVENRLYQAYHTKYDVGPVIDEMIAKLERIRADCVLEK